MDCPLVHRCVQLLAEPCAREPVAVRHTVLRIWLSSVWRAGHCTSVDRFHCLFLQAAGGVHGVLPRLGGGMHYFFSSPLSSLFPLLTCRLLAEFMEFSPASVVADAAENLSGDPLLHMVHTKASTARYLGRSSAVLGNVKRHYLQGVPHRRA